MVKEEVVVEEEEEVVVVGLVGLVEVGGGR